VEVEQEDFALSGRIPLSWTRRYTSGSERRGVCGYGWETPADARLEFEEDGVVAFHDGGPGAAFFDSLPEDEPVREPVDGGLLRREGHHLVVRTKEGYDYYFSKPRARERELVVESIRDLCGNAIQFVRQAGDLREIIDSGGRRLEVASTNGRIQSISLRATERSQPHLLVRYAYDAAGDLITVYDALNAPYAFQYREHRLVRHTNRVGLALNPSLN